jgi:V-type H+-transporting ATPase subunit H
MASSGAGVINKYGAEAAKSATQELVMLAKVDWGKYGLQPQTVELMKMLDATKPAAETIALWRGDHNILQACMETVGNPDVYVVQWTLTFLYETLREDSTSFGVIEDAMKSNIDLYGPLFSIIEAGKCKYSCDKAAWVLSALIGNIPDAFQEEQVTKLAKSLTGCSEVGALEATANLLKTDAFRAKVWSVPGVPDRVINVEAHAPAQRLYKSVFAMWLLSFDEDLLPELIEHHAVGKIRHMLASCRVEKVIRMCLMVLRALLQHQQYREVVVEAHMLEAVQNLEFEKWRDADLYDDIRQMAALISSGIQEMSNFARYEKELNTGSLEWGFIHTTKFWAENVMKFEDNDFKALKTLLKLLLDPRTDSTTLAVACHDVGEFVVLHPAGKKKVSELRIKERIMELMDSYGDDKREVRREAVLCCQRIMVNKWQDLEKGK